MGWAIGASRLLLLNSVVGGYSLSAMAGFGIL